MTGSCPARRRRNFWGGVILGFFLTDMPYEQFSIAIVLVLEYVRTRVPEYVRTRVCTRVRTGVRTYVL